MSKRLTVDNLDVRFRTTGRPVRAVNGVSFELDAGEILGLVGESGCGKSATARSLVRLEEPGEITNGTITFDGTDLTAADERTLRRLRGQELATIFQDPASSLNPGFPVGEQIDEALRIRKRPHQQSLVGELTSRLSRRGRTDSRDAVRQAMQAAGIHQPGDWIDAYPHQLSDGLRQRVMIAIALARRPSLLIADEPTTALDTTTQATIHETLRALNREYGMGLLFITHDLGVVSELCDRVLVMYDGSIVERGETDAVLTAPSHPYTKSLLDCIPRRSEPQTTLPTIDGDVPERTTGPAGCPFAHRCPSVTAACREEPPETVAVAAGHTVDCVVPSARAPRTVERTGQATPAEQHAADGESVSTDRQPVASNARARPSGDTGSGSATRDSDTEKTPGESEPIIAVEGVSKSFQTSETLTDRLVGTAERRTALQDVSLSVDAGTTMGLIGESGCGKSTLLKLIAGLETPTEGTVRLHGEAVGSVDGRTMDQRSEIGVVFQNPQRSINPKQTVRAVIAEPLYEAGWERQRRDERVESLLDSVGLPVEYAERQPRQLSGGQIQRVAIARALALGPSVVLLDEPTASLDVSAQATILNLLVSLQRDLGLTYLLVSHDLEVVRHMADRVAVMYFGQLVETGPATTVFADPSHPYTRTLLDAIPGIDAGTAASRPGMTQTPDPEASGCAFRPRCPAGTDTCRENTPSFESLGAVRTRCHHPAGRGSEEPRIAAIEESNRPTSGESSTANSAKSNSDAITDKRRQ
ncbi:ABC transporter ATP-binding protein [Halorhabdus sp. CUG00001]|uniref:dipeptide ABC transporter ATP-binding protein n=1 Tax=Halorhabdus sp. CUG00001 TaxID=2600297 RepID=UPI00131E75A7|nr:ABC transporter ATP-binding protein [Halorhabdus sp. CUG00001]